MKKFLVSMLFMMSVFGPSVASAATFVDRYGVWYGNICRAGLYYIVLPYAPVGTPCYIDVNGVRWHGAISHE
ncbi:hypothetical protein [Synechococcus phage BUCT-ZZ01]|nr:hypothetical protein [Synechococcus phage BUCT-ZZ01]